VAGRVGAGLGGRLLSSAAAGATEGALFGAGMATSEELLEQRIADDPAAAAGRILYAAGVNGLLGGALGAGTTGASELAKGGAAAVRHVLPFPEGPLPTASAFAERQAAEAAAGNYQRGHDALMARGETAGGGNRVGRKLLDEPDLPLSDPAAVAERARARKLDAGNRMGAALKDADGAVINGQRLVDEGRRVVSELRGRGSSLGEAAARKLEREVERVANRIDPPPGPDGVQMAPRPVTVDQAHVIQSDIGTTVYEKHNPAKRLSMQEEALVRWQSAIKDEIDTSLQATPGDAAAKWKAAREDYGDWSEVEKAASKHASARAKNRQISLTDYLAGAIGGTQALATGTLLPLGGAIAMGAANKALREKGSAALARIADAMSKSDGRLWQSARAIAGTIKEVPKRAGVLPVFAGADAYRRASEIPEEARRDPEAFQARVARSLTPLSESHPEVGAHLAEQTTTAVQALVRRLPQPRGSAVTLTPQAEPMMLTPEDEERFVDLANVVENPDQVLADIADGTADWDQVRALREAYPAIWSELRDRIAEECQRAEEPMPFDRRVAVGLAWELPTDVSLEPRYLAAMQSAMALPQPKKPHARPASATASRNLYGQFATKGDKLESP
jgi:hypothetical protein